MRLTVRAAIMATLFAVASLLPSLPAAALSESGTHAWSTQTLILSEGPGGEYDIVGEIPTDVAIKVLRCTELWCLVDGPGGTGWTTKARISFGRTPADWPGGINPDYPTGGSVCFFEGTNYTGTSFCADTGRVLKDLLLIGWDNRASSVQVNGTSVTACRDRDFSSYCERIIESQPVLHDYLRRALSSVRIY
jgi:hypothetical protein